MPATLRSQSYAPVLLGRALFPEDSQQPAALRHPGHFQVKNSIEADDHSQAGKDLRMVLQRQARKSKQPLWIVDRENAPGDVVDAGSAEDELIKSSSTNHGYAQGDEKLLYETDYNT